MGKITQEQRTRFAEKVQEYRKSIDALVEKEKLLVESIGDDATGAPYKRLMIADEVLNLTSYYLLLNSISIALLSMKNDDFLGDARKSIARVLKHVEDTVTGYIDVPFSDYEKNLEAIEGFSPEARYGLLSKLGLAIRELEEAYGSGSKWKWFFTDFWGKYATLAKNLLDLKALQANLDFSSPNRQITANHLALVKRQLGLSADRFREKYEAYSNTSEDFRLSILFLSALRRIHLILGERNEAEDLKKKITIWTAKLEGDIKRKEESKK